MSALICGSLAYDTIMVFPDQFKEHILPDKVHMLNVSFLVPKMRREFGGVAGNIAYSLKLLGEDPYPMATVGDDFGPYRRHMEKLGISTRYVKHMEGEFTPQAFITTDIDDNQITAFHPGAMQHSYLNRVEEAEDIRLGIVAPDGRHAMLQHSRDFVDCGIPHIFDPGQAMTLFSGEEFRRFIDEAKYIIVNDYEFQLLKEKSGLSGDTIANQVDAMIVTLGAKGAILRTREGEQRIEPVTPDDVQDPTGCGDAFRSGLIYGLLNDLDLVTACRIGSVMGAIKVAIQGPQNHTPTRDEIDQRFSETYGYRF
ncbi:MAG: carbohydrate kinase family protein [Gammaproteobacteria bacterium]|nr:carbohydrate kinase family protein [Gammaproteobacteria bacterium]NNJ77909.1 carbohydrate kinase family protein [Xanthomonadales bacterium]